MPDFLPDFITNLLSALLIFTCVTGVLVLGVSYWLWRRFTDYTTPDISKLNQKYSAMKAKNTKLSHSRAVKRIIRQQAFRCGMVGGVTSFGGFYTLPIALPVDIVLSTQIQATMVEFIAQQYGQKSTSAVESHIKGYIITTGSTQITRRTSGILLNFVTRLMGRSFAKLIPFIGTIIGFGVNYMIANATGNAAMKWYSEQAKRQAKQAKLSG